MNGFCFSEVAGPSSTSNANEKYHDLDKDACVTPVLDMEEAKEYEHHSVRDAFFEDANTKKVTPRPAPIIFSLNLSEEDACDGKSKL